MHYTAHFPVFKNSSTTALRIAYDASEKIRYCFHAGPNLKQRLQTMLLNFRKPEIALTADI